MALVHYERILVRTSFIFYFTAILIVALHIIDITPIDPRSKETLLVDLTSFLPSLAGDIVPVAS
jgi:hypothetical protein